MKSFNFNFKDWLLKYFNFILQTEWQLGENQNKHALCEGFTKIASDNKFFCKED